MTRDQEALRMQLGAQALRHAQHDAADQRSPKRTDAADDGGLEREQQLRGAGVRRESRANCKEEPGDADRDHRDRHGDGVHPGCVDSDEPYGVRVFSGRADRPAKRGVNEKQLQAAEHRDGRRERDHRERTERDIVVDVPTVIGKRADIGRQRTGIGAKALEKQIVDDDRKAECREHRHQLA